MKNKNLKGFSLVLMLLLIVVVALTGCNNDGKKNNKETMFTVSFNLDGGVVNGQTAIDDVSVKSGTEFDLSIYAPTKVGYTFNGWQVNGEAVADNKVSVSQNITLTATWTLNEYTITFELDGGQMDNTSVGANHNEQVNLNDYVPTKTGYTFKGWTLDNSVVTELTITKDVTVQATWEINEYTVTFELDGGKLDKTSVGAKYNEQVNLNDYVPTKTGYTFKGWSVNGTVATKLTVTDNVTVQATWEINKYTVTFELDGGKLDNASLEVNYNETVNLQDIVPTKEAFIFTGWTLDNVEVTSLTVTENVTVQANWENLYLAIKTEDGTGVKVAGFNSKAPDELQKNIVIPETIDGLPVVAILSGLHGSERGDYTWIDYSYNNNILSIDLTKCKHLQYINNFAFWHNDNLKTIDISGLTKLTTIKGSAFAHNKSLTSINLSGNTALETIESGAFGGDYNVVDSLASINLTGCTALKTIERTAFEAQDTIKIIDLSVCTALESLGYGAFKGCEGLEKVVLPASLKTLDAGDLFYKCNALKEIKVGVGSLYFISENGALYDIDKTTIIKYAVASDATSFVAPSTVTTIEGVAFANASNLTSIDLSQCTNLTSINYSAFENCTNVAITVPFNQDGYLKNGNAVTLGSGWNTGCTNIVYQTFPSLKVTINGLTDGMATTDTSVEFTVNVEYGAEPTTTEVKVNDVVLAGNVTYNATLNQGDNTIYIKVTAGEIVKEYNYTVTSSKNPTIEIEGIASDGIYTGDTIVFYIIAKDGSGATLTPSNINIKTDWGYGLYDLANNCYTMQQENEKIKVVIDTTAWYYEGGKFEMVIIANANGLVTEKSLTNLEHIALNVTVSGLSNNKVYTGDTIVFTVSAENDYFMEVIAIDNLDIKTEWGYGVQQLASNCYTKTVKDNVITITIDTNKWYYNGGLFDVILGIQIGTSVTTIKYTGLEHKSAPTVEESIVTNKPYTGATIEFTVEAYNKAFDTVNVDKVILKVNFGAGIVELAKDIYTVEIDTMGTATVTIDTAKLKAVEGYKDANFDLIVVTTSGGFDVEHTFNISCTAQ